MPRKVTKAAGNRYFKSRIQASRTDPELATRAGAAEKLPGITEECVKKYELGINQPPTEAVAAMAEAYNEPELKAWYCANNCPLGTECREIPDMPPERAYIRLQNSVHGLEEPMKRLAQLLERETLTPQEAAELPILHGALLECRRRLDENLAALEKAQKKGGF